ncbi:signal peptidase I [Eikenella sp. Marseille-P7795]|uniref:signal peptidase I n=1 Tax=Eikenella sp. Marseille-P7795 TaxID=2866577 RepID=UPI001CE46B4E|nr:signal peptidase I [Eikenella sp. Marseille-P7795]
MEQSNTILYAAIAALVAGIVLFAASGKTRQNNGEWSGGLQWGYLLMMVGAFGLLAKVISLTAVLLILVLLTGAVWLWARMARKQRRQAPGYSAETDRDDNHFRDYMGSFFPLILVVFVLRTFVAEPFQIPSSSMRPGLVKGDFVLVNKFTYGIRVPVLNNVLIPVGQVQRGDVVVFNYPVNPDINYIKRIVGLPGDVVEYRNKVLTVNGKTEQDTFTAAYSYPDDFNANRILEAARFTANWEGRQFEVLKNEDAPTVSIPFLAQSANDFAQSGYQSGLREHCEYEADGSGFKCTVPAGKYFAMGDNRDSSADSRYWGFVDDKLLVGKAFFVWMNVGDRSRIGNSIR